MLKISRSFQLVLFVAASLSVMLTGCSKRYSNLPAFSALPIFDYENESVGRFKTSYLADQIHAYFRGNASGPIAVATFVDLDNLYGTSSFGRMIAEQLMSELAMKGYNVREVRQSETLQVMFEQGEFGLSREVKQLRNHQDVAGLIVGTYTVSPLRVYLNARLIDPATSIIMSAGSVEMPKTKEIDRLLRNNAFPPALERIPVRSIGYYTYPLPYYWPYAPPHRLSQSQLFSEEEQFYAPEPKGKTYDLPKAKEEPVPAPRL